MEVFAGLSIGLLMLSALIVAIRTSALWRRSRELPELLLTMMLMSVTVIGYPLAVACSQIPAVELLPIHIAYPLAINFGFACLLLFTLRVFRPRVLWATCLVGLCLMLLVVCTVAYIVEATGENPRAQMDMVGLSLLNSAPVSVAYFWTTFESLSCYQRLRLQLRLGLTEGLVANRMLLWGLMTLAAGIAVIINAGALFTGSFMSPLIVSVSSSLGVVHASCLFLAFHPPGWYRGWVERRYAAEHS
jgi:hypothetical protein